MDNKKRQSLRDALAYLQKTILLVEGVCDREQDCMDNYPENLQGTDAYEKIEAAVDNLEEALEKLESAREYIQTAMT